MGLLGDTRTYVQVLLPEPASVALFGQRVFTDAGEDVDMSSPWIRGVLNPVTSVPIIEKESHRQRRHEKTPAQTGGTLEGAGRRL